MAVTVVEKVSGRAASAEAVTVTFADAVAGDLILFCWGVDQKEFGNPYWLPNTGWQAIPYVSCYNDLDGFSGMDFHIVAPSETSWNPVNDESNSVIGAWIAYRVQGHSAANPVLNYYNSSDNTSGAMYPNTVPGANSVRGMMFTCCLLSSGSSTSISGGVSGGNNWHIDTETDASGNPFVAAYVAAIDNITPSTGTWAGVTGPPARVQQWVVQAAPGSPSEAGSYILHEEVVSSEFSPFTGSNISFNTSFTPTPGNILLAVVCSSVFFPTDPTTPGSGWTLIADGASTGFLAGLRTIQAGDGETYTVATTSTRGDYYCYVYELTNVTYSGINSGAVTSPGYQTPFEGGVGQTLCFFPITVGTDENNVWPQYAMLSGQTSDGCGCSSVNEAAVDDKFVSVSSHLLTENGGSAQTGLTATIVTGYGATIVFDTVVTPSTHCELGSSSLNFVGNVSGPTPFYVLDTMGAEVVPTLYVDSTISINNGTMSPSGQAIVADGQWCEWHPNSGPLQVALPSGAPVRTLWVVTNQAKASPPIIPVWASSQNFPIWKQTCTP